MGTHHEGKTTDVSHCRKHSMCMIHILLLLIIHDIIIYIYIYVCINKYITI